ncbi:MAG: RNA 2',3'-cyclic phosphodiesterase [Candidatus ainarchaeum sp.]|nr:RNA 2',3'-cyclic phosphodiesterase [Candidatus ainarchaeum sp.]
MPENARLFFAVNFSHELKERVFKELVEEIPKNGFGKVGMENMHVTLVFLGYCGKEKIAELEKQADALKDFEGFEAELNCIGHFKGKVLWLGTGKGTEEFNLLAKKLCKAIAVENEEEFHAHVTLARNKGATKKEFDEAVEKLRKKKFFEKIRVRGFDLMQSTLTGKGPVYKKVFSVEFEE